MSNPFGKLYVEANTLAGRKSICCSKPALPQKTSTSAPLSIMLYTPPKQEISAPLPFTPSVPEEKAEPSIPDIAPQKVQTKQQIHKQKVAQKQPETTMPLKDFTQEVSSPSQYTMPTVEEKPVSSVSEESLHVKQKQYLEALIKRINTHKVYPTAAQKGHIEGEVLVEFTISPKGELLSCTVLEGKHIFAKATEKAISQSFPCPFDDQLFTSNITFQITLKYSLL